MSILARGIVYRLISLAHGDKSKETIISCMIAAFSAGVLFSGGGSFDTAVLVIVSIVNIWYLFIRLARVNGIPMKGSGKRLIMIGFVSQCVVCIVCGLITLFLFELVGGGERFIFAVTSALSVWASGKIYLAAVSR